MARSTQTKACQSMCTCLPVIGILFHLVPLPAVMILYLVGPDKQQMLMSPSRHPQIWPCVMCAWEASLPKFYDMIAITFKNEKFIPLHFPGEPRSYDRKISQNFEGQFFDRSEIWMATSYSDADITIDCAMHYRKQQLSHGRVKIDRLIFTCPFHSR